MNIHQDFGVTAGKLAAVLDKLRRLSLVPALIEESFSRGGGKGGQKINKSANRVQLSYPPLGLAVSRQASRSLALNRFLALRELAEQAEMKLSPGTSPRLAEWRRIQKRKARSRARLKAAFFLSAVFLVAGCGRHERTTALALIEPAKLAGLLNPAATQKRPIVLQVGFRELYDMVRIPRSEYMGQASKLAGLERLKKRVASLPRDAFIVIYCGCCPWKHCPNIRPAAAALRAMGFTNAWSLDIPHNFGTDWADKGYPVSRGRRGLL
jgi:hypothetical protein